MNRPEPLTVGKLIEILSKLDPDLPIYTHANNHGANDDMRVVLDRDPWFRVGSDKDFWKPPTLGVRIGNMHDLSGPVLFDMWGSSSAGEGR